MMSSQSVEPPKMTNDNGDFMKTAEIRKEFIDFFKAREHTYVSGSSTIPFGDQTILFTIAGMTQFKSALTGEETRPYKRATNSQKCIRIGDLDDVGKDGRHCTMFEMLGSWSFGDYFKKEAIQWAYEFVKDKLKFDMSKVWVSVYEKDQDAAELWKTTGQPSERIVRLGDKDNFWAMGPTGPCGPCTELHLDQGPTVGKCDDKKFDCKAGPGCDCDRYLEFWNLVFMQYDRKEDGSLTDLPFRSIDTGSGLERVAALSQGKTSVFDTDDFMVIKNKILNTAGLASHEITQVESLNVIADHIRTLVSTLADGCTFSAEGRGYVLRRVLRRAVRQAYKLSPNFPKERSFLAELVPTVIGQMGAFFPEMVQHEKRIQGLISQEESRFVSTLESGLQKFQDLCQRTSTSDHPKLLSAADVFLLHDSFGFPWDLTKVLAEEAGFKIDHPGFVKLMEVQKEKSRADAKFYKFDSDDSAWVQLRPENQTLEKEFVGYQWKGTPITEKSQTFWTESLSPERFAKIRQLKNRLFELALFQTPFYPESGGQVSDHGFLRVVKDLGHLNFEVLDVRKTPSGIVHLLRQEDLSDAEHALLNPTQLKDLFAKGCVALLSANSRLATVRNHTATHLMHKALQVVLGDGVRQAGSLVNPSALRFDFTHSKALTASEIQLIEDMVNQEILANTSVVTHVDVELDKAKTMGAMAIFDEKYDDKVRVLQVGSFSMELCGGTHVQSTGEIGAFKILSEGSVTAGVRRLEAVTGLGVLSHQRNQDEVLKLSAEALKCGQSEILAKIDLMKVRLKETDDKVERLTQKAVNLIARTFLEKAQNVKGVRLIVAEHSADSVTELEFLCDRLKEGQSGIVFVAGHVDDKIVCLCSASADHLSTHKKATAGNLIKEFCTEMGGKGGGRPDFARGGAPSSPSLSVGLSKLPDFLAQLL